MTNSPRDALDRRTVLKMAIAGAAIPTLAGCSGSGNEGDGQDLDEWFSDVENYDRVVDKTGSDEVTVAVGAAGNGGGFAFAPPAIRIDSGTTVVWEWTGDGGAHNVAAKDGSFGSGISSESGHTFEHAFEESGTYQYVCEPHERMEMKGAVVVE